jgi:hypothetical protein
MLTISNIYGHGFDRRQLSRLETLGFRIRPQTSTYMGSQICRFIDFEEGPALELIEVEDETVYLDFVPPGMKPYCPGISLALPEGSAKRIHDFERELRQLRPYALHVNYDGSTDPDGPGWHYLNFEIPIVPDTFLWLTGFDEPRPVERHDTHHPNAVEGIVGLVFDLETENLKVLSELVEESCEEDTLTVSGVAVWSKSTLDDSFSTQDKDFPLTAIVLKAESLDYFSTSMDGVREVSFMSRPAVHIETNRQSWDLWVTTYYR